MRNTINYIKSLDFAFVICLIAMTGQSFHTFYSFYAVSNIESDLFRIPESILLVIVFEAFTLFYLIRGRSKMAIFYSLCLFVMNCYYYISSGSEGAKLWLGIFLSAIIPISIYFVAEEVKMDFEKKEEINSMEILLKKLEEQFNKTTVVSNTVIKRKTIDNTENDN